jgi:hypothetical protein
VPTKSLSRYQYSINLAYDAVTYDKMVEFYIIDNWKGYRPPGDQGTLKGSVVVDGDTYDNYTSLREDKPSVHPDGTSTFTQYWSVRQGRMGSKEPQEQLMLQLIFRLGPAWIWRLATLYGKCRFA